LLETRVGILNRTGKGEEKHCRENANEAVGRQ
jgi:hypothetical protein